MGFWALIALAARLLPPEKLAKRSGNERFGTESQTINSGSRNRTKKNGGYDS